VVMRRAFVGPASRAQRGVFVPIDDETAP